jgi:hypothetical protein
MFHENENGSMQRSHDPVEAQVRPDAYAGALRRHIGSLEEEVARLRAALKGKDELEKSVARLREANENLVLAALADARQHRLQRLVDHA